MLAIWRYDHKSDEDKSHEQNLPTEVSPYIERFIVPHKETPESLFESVETYPITGCNVWVINHVFWILTYVPDEWLDGLIFTDWCRF